MSSPFSAIVFPPKLHVRSGPKASLESLHLLSAGDEVDVADIDDTGTWGQVTAANGSTGWVSLKYLRFGKAAPLFLNIAAGEVGVKENPDPNVAHPKIIEYLATVDDLGSVHKSRDETAWCSCFVNWCVEKTGLNGTNSATALSWNDWHASVAQGDEKPGDIAVFTRHSLVESGGHVSFFVRYSGDRSRVLLLGGNQSNAVRYSWFPVNGSLGLTAYRLISLRRS